MATNYPYVAEKKPVGGTDVASDKVKRNIADIGQRPEHKAAFMPLADSNNYAKEAATSSNQRLMQLLGQSLAQANQTLDEYEQEGLAFQQHFASKLKSLHSTMDSSLAAIENISTMLAEDIEAESD